MKIYGHRRFILWTYLCPYNYISFHALDRLLYLPRINMANKEIKLTKKNYGRNALSEWERLLNDPFHKLEFNTTLKFLKKYLPKRAFILDAGGGPGRYSIELAKMGHEIVLLDLVPEHLELAKKKIKKEKVQTKIKDIVEGSITDLSEFEDNSFDAVLCLGGPLSHVSPNAERQKAISELIRVAKKGALIFVSVMSKYGILLAIPKVCPQEMKYKKNSENVVFNGEDYMWRGKGYCHYFTSFELESLFSKNNVKIIEKVGLEGVNNDPEATNNFAKNYPQAWKNWLEFHDKICTDPMIVDLSGHMMIIVKKK
jgi:ubiquinone/menaquinone biosynthesis C-methylase UbiE